MQVNTVKFCDADGGENINVFAKQLVDAKQKTYRRVIGRFNGVYIHVWDDTTVDDIVNFYYMNL